MSSKNNLDTRTRILEASWNLVEKGRGQGVSMANIAKEAGISRQALYLHFDSRSKLMIATVNYVDEVKGLNERLKQFESATTGIELLETLVDVWGNYIPEIYGLAKALLSTRDTDEATAAAWDSSMGCLRAVCQQTIEALDNEGMLVAEWSSDEAVELFWTMISIHNWEQLTIECGWSADEYNRRMKTLLKRTFINSVK